MNTNPPSLYSRLHYKFEKTLSSGTIAIIGWLAVVSFLIILLAAIVIALFSISQDPEQKLDFWEALWAGLMHALDAGTLGGDSGLAYRAVMFVVTIGGIFIVSTLIGVLTSGFSNLIDELRKGKTKVLETNHTIILGWSPKVFDIANELIKANENIKKAHIVILANRDKIEMEDELRAKIEDTKTTTIICRTGSPLETVDIEITNPNKAKSIIILTPEEEADPDTHVIKSVLALTNHPHRTTEKYHIIAEVVDEENIEAANLVGGDETSFIFVEDMLSRITAQTARQSGLSVIYSELLSFEGSEIYFKEEKYWLGKSFKEVVMGYEKCCVIGIHYKNGEILLNPPLDYVMQAGDKVIAIAEDDSTFLHSNLAYTIDEQVISTEVLPEEPLPVERTLIIGWNSKGNKIIKELENYVGEGSEVEILCESIQEVEADLKTLEDSIVKQKIAIFEGVITKRAILQARKPASFDHITLLSNENNSVQEADAKTLIVLLHLRNMAEQAAKDFAIVSEMRDIRNKYLAEIAKIDDFIVGANLISLVLAQLSENKDLQRVFDNLFRAEGVEIYIQPIQEYVKTGVEMNFYTLLEAALRKGETAIGYKIGAFSNRQDKKYGIHVNPNKSEKISFVAGDSIIVISEK
jgi:ion channel POLLUX/CASTOR